MIDSRELLRIHAAAALGGALYFLGFVGFGIWPLIFVFLVPLWWSLDAILEASADARGPERRVPWTALAPAGLLFGLVAYAGGHTWLWHLVEVFLAGDRGLGALLLLGHALWFALGFAIYAVAFGWLRARGAPLPLAGIAPWLVVEWLQPQLFPVHAGSALVDRDWLVQMLELGGPLLASAFVVLQNSALYALLRGSTSHRTQPSFAVATAALAAIALALGYGALRERTFEAALVDAPKLRVGLVQANLGVLEKRRLARETHARHLELSRRLLEHESIDLLVWPETAILRGIRGPLPVSGSFVRKDLDVPLLFGGTLVRERGGRRAKANSTFLIEADGLIRDVYEKNLLIPLAESIPFESLFPVLAERLPHAQEFAASDEARALELGAHRIATPICYEIVRPSFVRHLVEATSAHLLVTIANDAWFGDSQEPLLHLQLARLRAVENRRALVRATNSGISALVDPLGRVTARTELLSEATLTGPVPLLQGTTLYTRFGDWPGLLAACALAGWAWSAARGTPGAALARERPS